MQFIAAPLAGVYIIEPRIFNDQRGFFTETYNRNVFEKQGFSYEFIQDNHSFSQEEGVIRGLHFQKPPHAQTKLVRVVKGSVYDVVVDLRSNSPTYGQWYGVTLTDALMNIILVPKGFAHGFCTLVADTVVLYKVDAFYAPQSEGGIRWDDPDIVIPWPFSSPRLSDKDKQLPLFRELGKIF